MSALRRLQAAACVWGGWRPRALLRVAQARGPFQSEEEAVRMVWWVLQHDSKLRAGGLGSDHVWKGASMSASARRRAIHPSSTRETRRPYCDGCVYWLRLSPTGCVQHRLPGHVDMRNRARCKVEGCGKRARFKSSLAAVADRCSRHKVPTHKATALAAACARPCHRSHST